MNKFGRYGVFPWVVALFAVTRLIPHWMPLLSSDIPGFAGYAVEFESAHRLGMSFFAFRAPLDRQAGGRRIGFRRHCGT
jgi:hypothetical protein